MKDGDSARMLRAATQHAQTFSGDSTTKVGALLLKNGTLLAAGANTLARGVAPTADRLARPAKYAWMVHAELNAIADAARRGVAVEGATCAITLYPCATCAKALVQAGIRRIVTVEPSWGDPTWGHEFAVARDVLRESGVHVTFQNTTTQAT